VKGEGEDKRERERQGEQEREEGREKDRERKRESLRERKVTVTSWRESHNKCPALKMENRREVF